MPNLTAEEIKKLDDAHPDLKCIFLEVDKYFDSVVLESFRNKEKQDIAFKTGVSQVQWPNGKHNSFPSNAVDVAPDSVPLDNKNDLDWKDIQRFYYFAGFVLGIAKMLKAQGRITHDIRWGGDWNGNTLLKDQKFFDLVHWELVIP